MRTTVTLDADVESLVRRMMEEQGISFKQALNESVRRGAAPRSTTGFSTASRPLGRPRVDLTHALRLAADLEDDELVRRLDTGS